MDGVDEGRVDGWTTPLTDSSGYIKFAGFT